MVSVAGSKKMNLSDDWASSRRKKAEQSFGKKMTKIPLRSKSKRPSFFSDSAVDQLVSVNLEMMAELWVVKERLYILENALQSEGISIKDKVENYQFKGDELANIEATRRKFIENILRSLESNFVDRANMQKEIDTLTNEMKSQSK